MQAVQVASFGPPSVLQIREVERPTPGANQVLIRIRAAGVNPVEAYIRSGQYARLPELPYTPGSDGAGEVEAVGEGVNLEIGARVFVTGSVSGTYAEFALCDASDVFPLPDAVSFAQGAALGIPYATAHRALFGKAGAKEGEFVFIHGASGGVGTAAIQLAKRAGCKVGGTAGSSAGEAFLERLGVRYTANHSAPDYLSDVLGMTCGRGADVILEMLANKNLGGDSEVLAPFGRIVVIGNRGEVKVDPRAWMARDATIFAMTLFNASPDEKRAIYHDLAAGLKDGSLQPVIGTSFPLADAARAHEVVMEGESRGKNVLVP